MNKGVSIPVQLLVWVVLSSLLFACVPAAFLGGAAVTSVIYDQRSTKSILLDQDLAYQIQLRLREHALLQETHISAYTFHRAILLVGQVSSHKQRDIALNIARQTPKVSRVYNQITLGKSDSLIERSKDTWITTKVKATLLAHSGLKSTQIKVITVNKIIYLMGIVRHSEGRMAIQLLRHLPDVRKVIALFEYID